jgi:pimeloyl-ACP methyl ester carboxylesterase
MGDQQESHLKIDEDFVYLRHSSIARGRTTILFVHGLGESGLCFQEVFQAPLFADYNLLVPDLVGYGRSSASATCDYSFDAQVRRLVEVVEQMGIGELVVVGHSLGGDLGTLFCASDRAGRVQKFVNIEGDLTQHDLIISSQAAKAHQEGRFEDWFHHDFVYGMVYKEWARRHGESCRRYYASLRFSRPDAFLTNALELCRKSRALPGKYQSEIGAEYCGLSIPKIFCFGEESLGDSETLDFLEEKGLDWKSFEGGGHWVMIDRQDAFYPYLHDFISS